MERMLCIAIVEGFIGSHMRDVATEILNMSRCGRAIVPVMDIEGHAGI